MAEKGSEGGNRLSLAALRSFFPSQNCICWSVRDVRDTMRSDDASKATTLAGGWFRNCHRTMPLCALGRTSVTGSQSPAPDKAPAVEEKDEDDDDDAVDDTGSGWDGRYLVQTGFDIPLVGAERRHSGWEAVEKRWGPPPPPPPPHGGAQAVVYGRGSLSSPQPLPATESGSAKGLTIGGGGGEALHTKLALPPPQLEPDFRLRLVLSPRTAGAAAPEDAGRQGSAVAGGAWAGKLGSGVVTTGGHETVQVQMGNGALATQVEASFQLRTREEPPAVIECRATGAITGPADVVRAMQATAAYPTRGSHRMVVTMKTSDERYAEAVNASMWVATCLWHGNEAIYE